MQTVKDQAYDLVFQDLRKQIEEKPGESFSVQSQDIDNKMIKLFSDMRYIKSRANGKSNSKNTPEKKAPVKKK